MGKRLHGKLFDAVDNIGEISPLVLCIRSGFLRAIFQDILFITFYMEKKNKLRMIENES